jgi:hypothetical protein
MAVAKLDSERTCNIFILEVLGLEESTGSANKQTINQQLQANLGKFCKHKSIILVQI